MNKVLATVSDQELENDKPLSYIPIIRYTNNKNYSFEGYYDFHNRFERCFAEDVDHNKDYIHVIMQDGFADWNMPRPLEAKQIIPDGGTIDIIWPDNINTDNVSDGYHTFGELYKHRAGLFATICNLFPDLSWKSKQHEDGSMFSGMFIVGINTPKGQASYHYDIDPYWSWFDNVREVKFAPHYDGYSDDESLERIMSLTKDNK